MADPSLDIQKAIVGALKGASPEIAGDRIYDAVPTGAVFPYISYGSDNVISDDADCITGYEVFVQIDVWSRATGQPEAKRIAGQVREALHGAELTLDDHALVLIEHRQTRYLDDPDGRTTHAAMEFRALVDAA